ncbi:universal stress protein A-like protein isoform X1 [Iris pallida]|uniref:Universal stress protein A-like protein isoform X1 n=1 Tax=Iris pallida TaxID=29817 RepID=A0AAX6E9Y4_IRIPA|nr:universal stress protein A-like protein isoform X1 [Iris pallida]KAJ6800824.1 universal stress protein A-like protein isoform X1 [Iris pallida]
MAREGEAKVMVAVDESDCSQYALKWALRNLRHSLAPPIVLFTVQNLASLTYLPAASFGVPPPELIQSVQDHQKKIALGILDRAKELCAQEGIIAETVTEVGDPKEAICEAAEKLKINLLILGNHGRGALQRAFLGSVSNYCVHNAKCPVLVVKNSM